MSANQKYKHMKERLIGGFIVLSAGLTFVVGVLIVSYFMVSKYAQAEDPLAAAMVLGVALSVLAACGGIAELIVDYMNKK